MIAGQWSFGRHVISCVTECRACHFVLNAIAVVLVVIISSFHCGFAISLIARNVIFVIVVLQAPVSVAAITVHAETVVLKHKSSFRIMNALNFQHK